MKIKKNLVAATAAVLAAGMALAGCGSSNGGSGDVQKTADGKVKMHYSRYALDDFNTAIDDFKNRRFTGRGVIVP